MQRSQGQSHSQQAHIRRFDQLIADSDDEYASSPASASSNGGPGSDSMSQKRTYTDLEQTSPTSKRQRKFSSSNAKNESNEVNLITEEGSAQALLEKEREELVKTQLGNNGEDEKPKKFNEMTCIICLDNFTNVTTTACGHVFCHECLTQALIQGEKQADRNSGTCPMCRKPLKRKQKGHVIPLSLMTRKKFQEFQRGR